MWEQNVEVLFNRCVGADTFLMGLGSREISSEAEPGQFVMVRVGRETDPLLRRPFSICGIQKPDCFLLIYRVLGRGTRKMAEVRQGVSLKVLGPLGRGFVYPENGRYSVLVAGGIGLAPLLFFGQRLDRKSGCILAGAKNAAESVNPETLGLLSLDFLPATEDGSLGYRGTVIDLLQSKLDQWASDLVVYGCGPIEMLKRIRSLTAMHAIRSQVSLEANMACGIGACQGCVVPAHPDRGSPYLRVCKEGPVFWTDSLNWEEL